MTTDDTPVGVGTAGMWDALAPRWDARGEWHTAITRDLTVAMVDALGPAAGETVVELACGPTADLAREVHRRLPGGTDLRAGDLSPQMVAAARRRASAEGAAITFTTLDVTALPFAEAGVDGLVARWIYMLLPDPGFGLREARRVLRPGGRLVFAVFGTGARNPFFTLPAGVVIERGLLPPPAPGEPSMFALADAGATTSLIRESGFAEASVREVPLTYRVTDADDLWSMVSEFSGPVSLTLEGQDEPTRQAIRAEIERRAARFGDGTGYALPGLALVFTATVPVG